MLARSSFVVAASAPTLLCEGRGKLIDVETLRRRKEIGSIMSCIHGILSHLARASDHLNSQFIISRHDIGVIARQK